MRQAASPYLPLRMVVVVVVVVMVQFVSADPEQLSQLELSSFVVSVLVVR